MRLHLLAAAGAAVLFTSAAAAHADTFNYSFVGPDGSFNFIDSSTPSPIFSQDGTGSNYLRQAHSTAS